ncbi:hypothetical protein FBZ93_105192 [Bradyrhizobium macuxiense]|uniref:Uncharacterized protein n=1 Tax=Bradyrhizobium macuxiense TaxID=1755647 RepID=A0A560M0U4_9BRAD|nr:hypothetical protein FBZ93_105192 [Bradyrhizobium macuxiense]
MGFSLRSTHPTILCRADNASTSLRAKRSNPSLRMHGEMDCFVASLLAMTGAVTSPSGTPRTRRHNPCASTVGWVERSDTHQMAGRRRDDGYRFAPPILRFYATPDNASSSLRAKRSNPSLRVCGAMNCFVASLLAMTPALTSPSRTPRTHRRNPCASATAAGGSRRCRRRPTGCGVRRARAAHHCRGRGCRNRRRRGARS